jgi:hypothetical protein
MSEIEVLKKNWLEILGELSIINRVSWLAYCQSYPLKVENNVLIIGVLDRSKVSMASEDKHKENLRKILLSKTKLNLLVEVQVLEDETIIRYLKDKKLFSTEDITKHQILDTNHNKVNTQNPFVTKFLAKRWQWILGLLFLIYFIFLFLDSKFEFVPESSNVPQQVNEFECKTYTDFNGEFVDPCGENYVPEENPGYQGR